MGKIRILQFRVARDMWGGTEKYIASNWRHIDKSRFSFDVVTHIPSLIPYQHLGFTDDQVKCVCDPAINRQQFIADMTKVIKAGYDVVHLNTSWWTGTQLEDIAKANNVPKVVVHSHSASVNQDSPEKRKELEKKHYQIRGTIDSSIATDFWACSNSAADWLFGEQIPREKIVIMKNAIEVEKFVFNRAVRERYRRELGLEDCFVIGHVGRFAYQKNHEFLLRIFAEIRRRRANARLLLIGGGKLEEDIRKQAEALEIEDSVLFLGQRDDVHNLLQAMDVFCLPSRIEGLGIVLIEAQSAGLKCLASDVVPYEARITDNIKFISPKDELWVQSLLEIAEGYERRNMYEEVTDAGYNIKQQIKKLEALYMK